MLRSLSIRDFTIIDALEIEFEPGFGAITGETGAGKSILIDALGLLLGDRADSAMVAEDRNRAELSALFELDRDHPARGWLADQALEDGESVLLRRSLPADGASRAWINGQPATVGQLREVGTLLVEIHGQHEHQRLTDPTFQRQWLDRHVDAPILEAVIEAAATFRESEQALEALVREAGSDSDQELLKFQLEELQRLNLSEGEFDRLETEQRRLASVEDLRQACSDALAAIEGEDGDGAATLAGRAARALEPLADRASELAEVVEMVATARVNLDEAGRALNRLNDDLESDPRRLDEIDRRLARALELARKHHVEPEDLTALQHELEQKWERISQYDTEREQAERRLAEARSAWTAAAGKLNKARTKAAGTLAASAADALHALGMADAELTIAVEPAVEPREAARVSADGADRIEILFSANPGQTPKPLKRVASGGELSRLSLAMIIASAEPADGLVRIFDEIDAGVGGETAHRVGEFLKKASAGGQAFCVTHLAQVASRADHQFQVLKQPADGTTRVTVQALGRDERIVELARMLGSASSTTSRQHATAMLGESGD